ncbi:hypothetical protein OG252_50740 [Streptomyces sp. NBC_01352]|uniref:hypothetical protein n=1 Tax=unclassified Streptomyces TaxID=2593676 RepID=UPI0022571449|nr:MULTISPECIES: hypothetical protein [unclassified Streptomyces]MCX4704215.1 hypothetical protein [Streptomyces sp. NBC_01373]
MESTGFTPAARIAEGSVHGLAAKVLVRLAATAPSLEAARREARRERGGHS